MHALTPCSGENFDMFSLTSAHSTILWWGYCHFVFDQLGLELTGCEGWVCDTLIKAICCIAECTLDPSNDGLLWADLIS